VRTGIEVAPDLVGGKILSNIPGRKLEAGDLAASGGQMGRQRGAVAGNSPNDATPAGRQDDSIRLYHGGNEDLDSIKGSGESLGPVMINRFGGLFASADLSTAKSFNENVNYMDISESDIARNSDLDDPEIGDRIVRENTAEDITDEEVDALYDAIVYESESKNYQEQSGIDEERFTELFEGFSDLGEASWEAQRLRGEIAKQLGFKAVEMRDETGSSYLVLPGTEVKRVTQGETGGANPDILFSRTDQTQTPAFREWFGDSEIVDDSGEPLVVYHGTNSEFSKFDKSKRGSVYDDDASRSGFFFTEDLEGSKFFAQKAVDKNGGEVFIKESHLKISEPFVITDDILTKYTNRWLDDLKESDPDEWDFQVSTQAYENSENISKGLELAISDAASKPMYDGVIVDLGSDERWFIAFEPEQIKTNNTISSGQIESD